MVVIKQLPPTMTKNGSLSPPRCTTTEAKSRNEQPCSVALPSLGLSNFGWTKKTRKNGLKSNLRIKS